MTAEVGARNGGAIVAVALATPGALGVETLARALLLPADLEQVRQDLRPTLTPVAWALLVLTVVAVPLGLGAQRALSRRWLARAEAAGAGPKKRAEVRFEAFFVGASVPQIPAVIATLVLTAGAEALPVLIAAGVSAAGVVAIGVLEGERA